MEAHWNARFPQFACRRSTATWSLSLSADGMPRTVFVVYPGRLSHRPVSWASTAKTALPVLPNSRKSASTVYRYSQECVTRPTRELGRKVSRRLIVGDSVLVALALGNQFPTKIALSRRCCRRAIWQNCFRLLITCSVQLQRVGRESLDRFTRVRLRGIDLGSCKRREGSPEEF